MTHLLSPIEPGSCNLIDCDKNSSQIVVMIKSVLRWVTRSFSSPRNSCEAVLGTGWEARIFWSCKGNRTLFIVQNGVRRAYSGSCQIKLISPEKCHWLDDAEVLGISSNWLGNWRKDMEEGWITQNSLSSSLKMLNFTGEMLFLLSFILSLMWCFNYQSFYVAINLKLAMSQLPCILFPLLAIFSINIILTVLIVHFL